MHPKMHRRPRVVGRAVACAVGFATVAPLAALAQDYRIERIASGLNQPTFLTQAPGDPSNILYFSERTSNTVGGFNVTNQLGKVWRYDTDTRAKTLVLDLSSRTGIQDDGLTAIAFNPDFANPSSPGYRKMYVSSASGTSGSAPVNRVEEYTIGAGGTATLSRTVLQYSNTATAWNNHTVNWIGFDPTATGAARSYLHISTGDGMFGLPNRQSQNPSSLLGKMLRVDVAGADAYPADNNKNFAIPPSNPLPAYNAAHPGSPIAGLGEVYVTGLRNGSRASFDRATGDLFIGDVGESANEELDFVRVGSNPEGPPVDFGWPQHEGTADTTGTISNVNPRTPTNPFTGVTSLKPIQQYAHGSNSRAIIGGYVYHGPIDSLQGKYVYSDYPLGTIWNLDFDRDTDPATFDGNNGTLATATSLWNSGAMVYDAADPNYTPAIGNTFGLSHIVSWGEDNSGNLYAVDFGGFAGDPGFNGQYPGAGEGEIFRLVLVTTSWNVNADGNWSAAGNWLRGVPNGVGAHAVFGSAITSPRTVTIDTPQTVGSITFDNTAGYTIAGAGSIVLDASAAQHAAIDVKIGAHSIAAPIALNDDLSVNVLLAGSSLVTSNLQPSAYTITKGGAGTWTVNSIRAAALSVTGGRLSTSGQASRVGTLTVGSAAWLDLNDNDLAVTSGSIGAISSLIAQGRNGGAWDAPGITSSAARLQASHATTLGVLSGAEYLDVNGSATFDGFAVAPSDVLVKYTWYGDTDFNGVVNFDDYVRADNGFNNQLAGWANGDFDLNGVVNFDDYVLIDLAFNTQSGTLGRALSFLDGSDRSLSGMDDPALRKIVEHYHDFADAYARTLLASVPEPSTLALIGVPVVAGMARRSRRRRRARLAIGATLALVPAVARAQLSGNLDAHDPSTLIKDGDRYYYFCTGQGIAVHSSPNKSTWFVDPPVFSSAPSWIAAAVPGFAGNFWAPDIAYFNGLYHLYYSASTWGSQVSAIGLATSPTLDRSSPDYAWTDRGMVIQSINGSAYNTIDPSIIQDSNGRIWMTFGSYWNGVYETEINPSTGKRVSGSPTIRLANNSQIEASYMFQHDGFYYLFVNWGTCCQGVNSTYNIRVGRSTSVNGPFLDKNGVNMINSGGSLFLANDANRIGPGHIGIISEGDLDQFSYHFYNANNNGAPTYNLRTIYWDANGWPSYTAINPFWTGSTNGNWSVAGNWSGGVANGKGHTANFGGLTSGQYNVALDNGPKTVGSINFDSAAASYTIGGIGNNALVMDATTGSANIAVLSGSHMIAAPVTLNDDLNITINSPASTLLIAGAITANEHAINKHGGGAVAVRNVRTRALNVNGGTLRIFQTPSPNDPAAASVVTSLAVSSANGAALDLANNSLVVDYTGGSALPAVRALIASGRNGGQWDAPGIVSSAAKIQPSHATTLGLMEAADYHAIHGAASLFAGQAIDNTAALVKYTWYGDADFNGIVNFDDYVRTDNGFNNQLTGWMNGDFDLNGVVNFDDYVLIDLAFNTQEGTLGRAIAFLDGSNRTDSTLAESDRTAPGVGKVIDHFERFGDAYARAFLAAVPEPNAVALLGVPALAGVARRRRAKVRSA